MRPGLSILTFDKARAETLDSYEITKKSPPPLRLSASMCAELKVPGRCHQINVSVYLNLEQHSLWPSFTILIPWNHANIALRWLLWPVSTPTPSSPTVLWEPRWVGCTFRLWPDATCLCKAGDWFHMAARSSSWRHLLTLSIQANFPQSAVSVLLAEKGLAL